MLNKHNYTIVKTLFSENQVIVGKKTYGELNIFLGTNTKRNVQIGNFCSIGPNVQSIINPHNYRFFSTWPFQRYEYNEYDYEWENKTSIIVDDDVWIGQGAIILGGAHLRQGCVIGAGSVVSCDVPEYAIYVSGRVIKYRFSESIREKLRKIDYSSLNQDVINRIKGWHKKEITEENVDELLAIIPIKNEH
jgi:acetyltransferase-like isoleucine patch superfamily enzyme